MGVARYTIASEDMVPPGQHTMTADFKYDGGGPGKGGGVALSVDGRAVAVGRVGRTITDGDKGERLGNVRLGLTLALPVTRRNSIKLYGSIGVYTRTGTDFQAAGIAWQYRWGGGL